MYKVPFQIILQYIYNLNPILLCLIYNQMYSFIKCNFILFFLTQNFDGFDGFDGFRV